jgi:hypothetical protein
MNIWVTTGRYPGHDPVLTRQNTNDFSNGYSGLQVPKSKLQTTLNFESQATKYKPQLPVQMS